MLFSEGLWGQYEGFLEAMQKSVDTIGLSDLVLKRVEEVNVRISLQATIVVQGSVSSVCSIARRSEEFVSRPRSIDVHSLITVRCIVRIQL